MGAGNDVGSHQAIANALTGISTGANGSIHSTGLTPNHHGDVTTAYKLAADKGHLSGLGHGISCFDRRHHPSGLNHAQSDALNRARRGGTGRTTRGGTASTFVRTGTG